jgi:galactokinase
MLSDRRHAVSVLTAKFQDAFGRLPIAITYAPGRIEVIGNHTDYNGGPVIGAAIDRGVWVAVAPRTDGCARLRTTHLSSLEVELSVNTPKLPRQSADAAWSNYPLGVIEALAHFGMRRPEGFDYLAMSDLPAGSGLSSSAAIELASALAFLRITDQACSLTQLATIGRHAENKFVGVPCGILDQGVSAHGREGKLVVIDCAALTFSLVALPAGAEFWVFNTHTKHALVDGLYATRHRECMQAAAALGVRNLAEIDRITLARESAKLNKEQFSRAMHVVDEIDRVKATISALQSGKLVKFGQLLTDSHTSSRLYFQNSTPELDYLVDHLVSMAGVYGARLTGGGFGGAAMALTSADFSAANAETVAQAYFEAYGQQVDILRLQAGDGAQVLHP